MYDDLAAVADMSGTPEGKNGDNNAPNVCYLYRYRLGKVVPGTKSVQVFVAGKVCEGDWLAIWPHLNLLLLAPVYFRRPILPSPRLLTFLFWVSGSRRLV
jgi:hypothetical protein